MSTRRMSKTVSAAHPTLPPFGWAVLKQGALQTHCVGCVWVQYQSQTVWHATLIWLFTPASISFHSYPAHNLQFHYWCLIPRIQRKWVWYVMKVWNMHWSKGLSRFAHDCHYVVGPKTVTLVEPISSALNLPSASPEWHGNCTRARRICCALHHSPQRYQLAWQRISKSVCWTVRW